MTNNRIKHFLDDDGAGDVPLIYKFAKANNIPIKQIDHTNIEELKTFINSVEDKVCEVMGEAFCDGKLFGINIMVNPETRECRIWRCDV